LGAKPPVSSIPVTFTVVIPTLNEAGVIEDTLRMTAHLGFEEILVVDGGSSDDTRALVESVAACAANKDLGSASVRLLSAPAGRARQLNAGAALCTSDALLFLHADTHLPVRARQLMEDAFRDPMVVGGRFDVSFDHPSIWAHIVSTLMNARSRLTRISTGDQAIFVRRQTFERLSGFADIPIMEDIDFSSRLKRAGKTAAVSERVITSFRRWEQQGPLQTIVLMWSLRFLYWIGVSPHRIARLYAMVR
jgi:rSAM/selenodomain-associated transferase 2